MREILFRGKRIDNGEWVYGYYEFYNGGHYINVQTDRFNSGGYPIREFIEVIPETVGQYTGLTANGKKIFEGDIINIEYSMTTIKCAVVEYVGSAFVGSTDCDCWDLDNYYALEVIGNIHDNPELLKGGE